MEMGRRGRVWWGHGQFTQQMARPSGREERMEGSQVPRAQVRALLAWGAQGVQRQLRGRAKALCGASPQNNPGRPCTCRPPEQAGQPQ